jgi:hypothetical protein
VLRKLGRRRRRQQVAELRIKVPEVITGGATELAEVQKVTKRPRNFAINVADVTTDDVTDLRKVTQTTAGHGNYNEGPERHR